VLSNRAWCKGGGRKKKKEEGRRGEKRIKKASVKERGLAQVGTHQARVPGGRRLLPAADHR